MDSPYRERPRFLGCPRCGEMLEATLRGVSACPRCAGWWLELPAITAAFGDRRWPGGPALWWRSSIDCPACACDGKTARMAARLADDVLVDQCPAHGVWLDRGELGRLLGGAADELGALRRRIAAVAPELAELVGRSDVAPGERPTTQAARQATPPRAPSPPTGAADREQLAAQRAQAGAAAAQLYRELTALRDHADQLEEELSRARRRADTLARELEAARERVRLLDAQLGAPG